jgi:hypothetical protein
LTIAKPKLRVTSRLAKLSNGRELRPPAAARADFTPNQTTRIVAKERNRF